MMNKKLKVGFAGAVVALSALNSNLSTLAAGELRVVQAETEFGELPAGNYKVETAEDLVLLASLVNSGKVNPDAAVDLVSDIAVTDLEEPIGKDAENGFGAKFNGRYHKLEVQTNFKEGRYFGLFGVLNGSAEVKNLKVFGQLKSSANFAWLGAIAGLNKGEIENCRNEASVTATGGYSIVGGIVGGNPEGEVINCGNAGAVSGSTAGGISGVSAGPTACCYNTGAVSGWIYTGGIMGISVCAVKNCYNLGDVSVAKAEPSVAEWERKTPAECKDLGKGRCEIQNCHYRVDCLGKFRGNRWGNAMDAAAMQTEEFVRTLNENKEYGEFCFVAGQYPVLAWELNKPEEPGEEFEMAGGVQGADSLKVFDEPAQEGEKAAPAAAEVGAESIV